MTEPTRVLHIITGLSTGGAEMMLRKLLTGTDPGLVQSRVATLTDGGALRGAIQSLGVQVESVGMARGSVPLPRTFARLRRIVREYRPHVVQGWMYHGNLAALAAAAGRGLPVAWNVRSSLNDVGTEKRLTAAVIRAGASLSRRAACIVYPSAESARQHEAIGYADCRRVLIPNGFDTERFAPVPDAHRLLRDALELPSDAIVIGHVARFHDMKDHPTLLRAAARLAAVRSDVYFVLIGRDVDERNPALASLTRELDLKGRMRMLGERHDVERLTAGFDLATSSSAWGEAFPNVLGEAMACAVPCVATDVGDSAAVIGDTGYIVRPRDPDALAAAWAQLLALPAPARMARGTAARARVLARYSLSAVVERYSELYASLRVGTRYRDVAQAS